MASNDISKSQERSLNDLVGKYKDLGQEMQVASNFLETLKRQIIDFYELLNIDSKDGVRLVEKVNVKKVTIKQLKKLLNIDTDVDLEDEDSIFNNIVVQVDIDKTVDNMIYVVGLARTMSRKIGERLRDLQETKYIDLEVSK